MYDFQMQMNIEDSSHSIYLFLMLRYGLTVNIWILYMFQAIGMNYYQHSLRQ
jgi:hypothetical protein